LTKKANASVTAAIKFVKLIKEDKCYRKKVKTKPKIRKEVKEVTKKVQVTKKVHVKTQRRNATPVAGAKASLSI